jgi:hypothetical protein
MFSRLIVGQVGYIYIYIYINVRRVRVNLWSMFYKGPQLMTNNKNFLYKNIFEGLIIVNIL